nr:MAG TPA: hypothetical protein [Caudoviricetes sp.]
MSAGPSICQISILGYIYLTCFTSLRELSFSREL